MCTASIAKRVWVRQNGRHGATAGQPGGGSASPLHAMLDGFRGQVVEWGWNTVRSHLATPRKENGIGKGRGNRDWITVTLRVRVGGRGGLPHVGSWS